MAEEVVAAPTPRQPPPPLPRNEGQGTSSVLCNCMFRSLSLSRIKFTLLFGGRAGSSVEIRCAQTTSVDPTPPDEGELTISCDITPIFLSPSQIHTLRPSLFQRNTTVKRAGSFLSHSLVKDPRRSLSGSFANKDRFPLLRR